MTRSTLTQQPRATRVVWSLYALTVGMLACGAGYAAARVSGVQAAGAAVAVLVTAAAGWWGAAVVQRLVSTPHLLRAGSPRRAARGRLEGVRS
jgi:hypothetical protein